MAKILVHTIGSAGDLNPFLALALELRRRGHHVHFALCPSFAAKARGLGFVATDVGDDPDFHSDLMKRLLEPSLYEPIRILYEQVLVPSIVPTFDALAPLARDSDLFLSHTAQLASPAVAYRTGVPWVSAIPAITCYPTGQSPPPGLAWKGCPPIVSRATWALGRRVFRHYVDEPANREYRKLGVPRRRDILISNGFSKRLTLGMWSPSFFPRPADWPSWIQVGGYPRWDGPPPPELEGGALPPAPPVGRVRGETPLVIFTLGTSVVNDPRDFYETALQAIAPTSWRALLLGAPADFPIPPELQARVTTARYAPFGQVFPLASAVVHQGGVGTTQSACYYGVPSLIVPRGYDQYENAAHIQREGWGLRLLPHDLSPTLLRLRLERLLHSAPMNARLADLSRRMQAEPNESRSADLLEEVLAGKDFSEPGTAQEKRRRLRLKYRPIRRRSSIG